MREQTVKSGAINGHYFDLKQRHPDLVLSGAAPYILYVDDAFYCTSESRNAANDEISPLSHLLYVVGAGTLSARLFRLLDYINRPRRKVRRQIAARAGGV